MAVVPVVLYHAGVSGLGGGFVGVDVFFVISGFLITGILHREMTAGAFSLAGFYERRARRILPALFAVVAGCLAVGAAMLPPAGFSDLAGSALATLAFASNVWFWRAAADYFAPASDLQPLLHTWSLGVEEQFYILFPLLLWVLVRFLSHRTLVAATALACAGSFAVAVWGSAARPEAAFYLLPTRAWELGLGALLALGAFPAAAGRGAREAAAALGLAAIALSVVAIDAGTRFPAPAALLPCLGALAILWAGGCGGSLTGRLLSHPAAVAIGLISYSLYLWHWPVLAFLRLRLGTIDLPAAAAATAVAVSLLLAALSWRLVETPFRRRGGLVATRRGVAGAAVAGTVAMAAAAGVVVAGAGLPGRGPPAAQAAYAGAADVPDAMRLLCEDRPPDLGPCPIGSVRPIGGRASVLLWGDSRAAVMVPGLSGWLAGRGLSGAAAFKSACPPLLGVRRADMASDHGCDSFNDAVMAMLRQSDDYPTVILSARWALAAEGVRAPGEGGSPAILRDGSAAAGDLDPAGNHPVFVRHLGETVDAIRATGRRVVVIGSVPEIGWSVPEALGNHIFSGTRLPPTPGAAEVAARNVRVDALFDRLAREHAIEVVRVDDLLCAAKCRVEVDGRPLYSDSNHLSVFGSEHVVPRILDASDPVL